MIAHISSANVSFKLEIEPLRHLTFQETQSIKASKNFSLNLCLLRFKVKTSLYFLIKDLQI